MGVHLGGGLPRWSARDVGRAKPFLFLLGLVPFLRWWWLGLFTQYGLTANPVQFLTWSSGTWTLVCLCVTLAITPVRQLLNQPALVRLRRMCGLFAFFYGTCHFLTWVVWDRNLDPRLMVQDLGQRPFILVGFSAFVLMALLALTSTQGWMRRLGRRWQLLHRAIYVIGPLAILHFWWMRAGKNNFFEPTVYGAIILGLLLWRLARRLFTGVGPRLHSSASPTESRLSGHLDRPKRSMADSASEMPR